LRFDPGQLEPEESARLAALEHEVPEAKRLCEVVQGFAGLLRDHAATAKTALEAWLSAAKTCGIPEVKRFVQGVLNDFEAVLAGMSLPWSNGQVEGQVTRLKAIKRSMYGRAKFDLLRARVLLA
jgi:transposase